MRAILVFRLPDEEPEHRAALAGVDALIALERIDRRLRATAKYGDPTPEEARLADDIRQMIPAELLEILQ